MPAYKCMHGSSAHLVRAGHALQTSRTFQGVERSARRGSRAHTGSCCHRIQTGGAGLWSGGRERAGTNSRDAGSHESPVCPLLRRRDEEPGAPRCVRPPQPFRPPLRSREHDGFQAPESGRGDQDHPLRVRAAAEPIRRAVRGRAERAGDGTMLLAASKVLDRFKPVIGVNTDPERSEGHLCLPVQYTQALPEALRKLYRGEFRWLWRQRIRLFLEGTGINLTPVDLHDQQLSLEQHSKAHVGTENLQEQMSAAASGPHLLPVRALNEVFIGESLSSRASYYEISVDDGPWEKQKSSGLNVCTGTGSKAWSYNINKIAPQSVEEVLSIAKSYRPFHLDSDLIERVTKEYNDSLVYSPEEPRMLFSVREPIANRVFSSSRQRGVTSKVCVRSRCWDACMVVDGGTSFEFNDGAIVSISMDPEDALCTVQLND
uniref:NAD kinase 2, mitochondrial n=1 Tax=Leptobrachium leishanense TaxID=445787 RepID=A0A8C5LKI7_9ANUR